MPISALKSFEVVQTNNDTKYEFYLGIQPEEWAKLFSTELDGHLIPCCDNVEKLREVCMYIYGLGINRTLCDTFADGYIQVCKDHDMKYAITLHKLAAWVHKILNRNYRII